MADWTLYDLTMVALLLVCFVIGVAVLWALREIDKDLKWKSRGRWQDMKGDDRIKLTVWMRLARKLGPLKEWLLKKLNIKRAQ